MSINSSNYSTRVGGLELARHILRKIKENNQNFTVDSVSKEYKNKKFVYSITDFLKEIKWVSVDKNGKYIVTPEGLNSIDDLRF